MNNEEANCSRSLTHPQSVPQDSNTENIYI